MNAADSELLAFAVVATVSPFALFFSACCLSCSAIFLALRIASMDSSSSENPVVLTADMASSTWWSEGWTAAEVRVPRLVVNLKIKLQVERLSGSNQYFRAIVNHQHLFSWSSCQFCDLTVIRLDLWCIGLHSVSLSPPTRSTMATYDAETAYPQRYLLHLARTHPTFRIPELDSCARMFGFGIRLIATGDHYISGARQQDEESMSAWGSEAKSTRELEDAVGAGQSALVVLEFTEGTGVYQDETGPVPVPVADLERTDEWARTLTERCIMVK